MSVMAPASVVSNPPGVQQAAKGCYHFSMGNQGTLTPPTLVRVARMPAGGRADGGGVVIKSSSVMGETG